MKSPLAEFLRITVNDLKLTATNEAALQRKLIAVAIDPLFLSLPLERAQKMYQGQMIETLETLLTKMTLAQLKKVSRNWNPYRAKFPRELDLVDLRNELKALLTATEFPAAARTTAKKAAAKRAPA